MNEHEKMNYVEFPCRNIAATKAFFTQAFNWAFEDYGPDYAAFSNEGLDGGFYTDDKVATAATGSALIVFYSSDIGSTEEKVRGAGGDIVTPLFDFPGGRRFHFTEPSGNEFAVWTDPTP
ncbi:MAG: VOC family protein [Pseudomonadales bacterium]